MIEIKNLDFFYKKNKPVLADISCEFNKGRIYGLLGKNGVGKTTLLHLVAGLQFPKSGEITLRIPKQEEGDAASSEQILIPSERKRDFLKKISFINEEMGECSLRIDEFERYNSVFYPNFSHEQFVSYLRDFEVEDLKQKINKLSLGTRKKIYICFALACNTEFIFMDEPTNGLDIPSKSAFRKMVLNAMTDEKTMIISTHQARDLQNILDNIIILDNTSVLMNASADDICEKLWFGIEQNVSSNERILYQEDTVAGLATVKENKNNGISNLDVELLFNAAFLNKTLFKELFKN
ncbi:MAG: ATP-binding cassette domain-containing protein [Bacteroidales bacterium]|nr:ATP-binding cassette domain-containing protein [Bacteroidales bacterium]